MCRSFGITCNSNSITLRGRCCVKLERSGRATAASRAASAAKQVERFGAMTTSPAAALPHAVAAAFWVLAFGLVLTAHGADATAPASSREVRVALVHTSQVCRPGRTGAAG